jgi:CRISPR/Cas system-associated exonuclease Cas4 (RecB family)
MVMEIKELPPLVLKELEKFTPSNLNWILRCPLRALYANPNNRAYLKQSTSAYSMIGNVIHKINEDFTMRKITTEEEFEEMWREHENKENANGLKFIVKNYGVLKSLTKSNMLDILSKGRSFRDGATKFELLPEEDLKDEVNKIQGKLDLLILKGGKPVEVRDYKTGNIYDIEAKQSLNDEVTGSSDDNIKEDYQKQLLLYAWLVKQTYDSFPEKLTIVTNDGALHHLEFTQADVYRLINEINELKDKIKVDNSNNLAKPSAENCKFCNFRFACRYKATPHPDPVGDIYGHVTSIKPYPYGSLEFQLNNSIRVLFPSKVEQPDKYNHLMSQNIVITFVRGYYHNKEVPRGLSEFYVPTKMTELIKKT